MKLLTFILLLTLTLMGCSKEDKSPAAPPVPIDNQGDPAGPMPGTPGGGFGPEGNYEAGRREMSLQNLDREKVLDMLDTLHRKDQFLYFCVRTITSSRGDRISSGALYYYRQFSGKKLKIYKKVIDQNYEEGIFEEAKKVKLRDKRDVYPTDFYLSYSNRSVVGLESSLRDKDGYPVYLDLIHDAPAHDAEIECTENI